jgi:GDP-mannose 6-dehydrogenase
VNIQAVQRVLETIGHAVRRRSDEYCVVVRSTLLPGILEEKLVPLLSESAGTALGERIRLCNNPEFLREGTAIRDFDRAPFVLVGVTDVWDAEPVTSLYEGVRCPRYVTDSRTAAMVKYACNAFHATKVAFANEIGTLAKSMGADGPEVMQILCKDTTLNTSSAYLRPGFAFGGSCLPKDLRALNRYAEHHAVRTSLLRSILPSNEEHLRQAVSLIQASGHQQIGLVGLSFKVGTDDLRESPAVILAETLLGRGYDIKIYDPGVQLSRLRGRNRAFVDQHLPHLAALLVDDQNALCQHASLLVIANDIADELDWPPDFGGEVIDLRQDLVRAKVKLVENPV